MIRNIINLKAIILLFWIDFMFDSRYADSGLWEFFISVKDESYVLVINSYVDGERWSGNLLNMISKFATPGGVHSPDRSYKRDVG